MSVFYFNKQKHQSLLFLLQQNELLKHNIQIFETLKKTNKVKNLRGPDDTVLQKIRQVSYFERALIIFFWEKNQQQTT